MYNKCCPELRLPNCPEEFGCPRSLTRIIPEQTNKISEYARPGSESILQIQITWESK